MTNWWAKTLAFVKVACYIGHMTNSNLQTTAMANLFDQLVSELSEPAQKHLSDMVQYLANDVLAQGAGEMSAKELILKTLMAEDRYKNGYRWNGEYHVWQRPQ